MKAKLKIRRIYEPPEKSDGFRILVDRLWPRGISKDHSAVDIWLKNVAPSPKLRRWFSHDPDRWDEFKSKYLKELKANRNAQDEMRKHINGHEVITLLYAAKNTDYNHALVLKDFFSK